MRIRKGLMRASCLLLLAAGLLIVLAAGGCRRRPPPGDDVRDNARRQGREEVVKGPSRIEPEPEIVPLDSPQRYLPPGGMEAGEPQDGRGAGARVAAAGAGSAGGSADGSAAAGASVEELLDSATQRSSCNPVMGCPAGEGLAALGAAAVGPIIERYRAMEKPGYQKFHLVEILGRIGAPSALPFLRELLGDGHWNVRSNAAVALGRSGAVEELGELRRLLREQRHGRDFGFLCALAFAVERLGGTGGREVLMEALAPDRVARVNWGYTRIAVAAVRELAMKEACVLLEPCVRHNDFFLKKEAMGAAGDLGCGEAGLRDAVAAELASRVPSVRREARGALEELTGVRFDSLEQWVLWRDGGAKP